MPTKARTWRSSTSGLLCLGVSVLSPVSSHSEVLDLNKGTFQTSSSRETSANVGVIDFGASSRRFRVYDGVIDFNRPAPPESEARQADPASAPPMNVRASKASAPPELEQLIRETAMRYLRDPGVRAAGLSSSEWLAFFRANIAIESGFDAEIISPAGAIGLGQLMPDTAKGLGVDPFDPAENLDGSARYLLEQLQTFKSKELALAAYNAGPDAVVRYGGIPPYRETRGHVRKVLAVYGASL